MSERVGRRACGWGWVGAAALVLGGCVSVADTGVQAIPDASVDVPVAPDGAALPGLLGAPLGESCDDLHPCRQGLVCTEGACAADGSTAEGGTCFIADECAEGLTCSLAGACVPAGTAPEGAPCSAPSDCASGLTCVLEGFAGTCTPAGTSDVTQPCEATTDCAPPLVCDTSKGACTHPVLALAELFTPRSCPADDGSPRVYFEVPRGAAGDEPSEFYRLPFPNGVRAPAGRVTLSGHPTLPVSLLSFDPVDEIVQAIERYAKGFALVAPVLFRFSQPMDIGSFRLGTSGSSDAPTIALVGLSPESPDYGKLLPAAWQAVAGPGSGGRYVCDNWLAVRPLWSRPLRPGRTYAAVVLEGVLTEDGATFGRDADFDAMLAAQPPGDPALAAAWSAYAPLRALLDDPAVDLPFGAADVIDAAVFTTAPVGDTLGEVAKIIDNIDPPEVRDLMACDGSAPSPCDDGLEGADHVRGCFEVSDAYWELQAHVVLPIFQRGTPPYLHPEDGGAIVEDASAKPAVQRSEEVCMALTVPRGVPMPEDGWPVVLYAHGTGGNYRSPIVNGIASRLTDVELPDGQHVHFAVLSIDQVQHGPRRGSSDLDPEVLFFNFRNPPAALGNVMQAAADALSLERLAATWSLDAADSPTGEAIRFDPTRIYYLGHSQGALTGASFLGLSRHVRVAVLSGAAGGLALAISHKRSPVDIAGLLPWALGDVAPDGSSRVSDNHPVLGLLQHLFAPVDPLSWARTWLSEPLDGASKRSVLQVWGLGDTFSPDPAAKALASAAGLVQAEPVDEDIAGTLKASPPLYDTHGGATGVVADYVPDGYDGHFVLFENPDATRQAIGFLGSAVQDAEGLPTFPE